jgi:hypothetical protein
MNNIEEAKLAFEIGGKLFWYKERDDAFSKRKVEAIGQRLKEVEVLVNELLSNEEIEDYVEIDL